MSWERAFISQSYGRPIYKHEQLSVYITDEFNFFRCVEFKADFYGKTASTLFNGNLRICSETNRYAKLFPNQKLSYWADSPDTARAEIKKHGAGSNILTFWAYDDGASTFPILQNEELLTIIDGRKTGVQELIDKADKKIKLSNSEQNYINDLMAQEPDCLAYDSHAKNGGENFIFFEKGFKKLALRQLQLRFSKNNGGNVNRIVCADTSDYIPFIESYGMCFQPKVRVKMDKSYLLSDEYLQRKEVYEKFCQKVREQ
jgi:hypothetical protein